MRGARFLYLISGTYRLNGRRAGPGAAVGALPRAALRLVGLQDEEHEAQGAGLRRVLEGIGKQLAGGARREERFVDGCYPEVGRTSCRK